uniref:Uncharacterized protein n=1 Tax=Latimeria chalumnae TaxID=7897 RepID=H3BBN5_LATCH
MGCASAKHVSTVQNEEEAQKGKNYQNGDVFGDEYKIKAVEEVKYMKNGEEEQNIAARNQENLVRLVFTFILNTFFFLKVTFQLQYGLP